MKIANIDRLMIFREDKNGHVLSIDELQARYGVRPAGTDFYYGINQENVDESSGTTNAFDATDRDFFQGIVDALKRSSDDEVTIVLGLEPLDDKEPFGFVTANLNLVERLASQLDGFQKQARAGGKRLNLIVRYASEMNSGDNSWGLKPMSFKSTYVQVRSIFSHAAPGIMFSFSPALRADRDESLITSYWPGDQYVDIIGGTWYIGKPEQHAASVAMMRSYFMHRVGVGKPFGLSEIGGLGPRKSGNDVVLESMLHEIEAIQLAGVSFKYATIYLKGIWGTDATLKFLSGEKKGTSGEPPTLEAGLRASDGSESRRAAKASSSLAKSVKP